MAKTDLTNQRQVFVEEYVRSGDHLEAAIIAQQKLISVIPRSNYTPQSTSENGLLVLEKTQLY